MKPRFGVVVVILMVALAACGPAPGESTEPSGATTSGGPTSTTAFAVFGDSLPDLPRDSAIGDPAPVIFGEGMSDVEFTFGQSDRPEFLIVVFNDEELGYVEDILSRIESRVREESVGVSFLLAYEGASVPVDWQYPTLADPERKGATALGLTDVSFGLAWIQVASGVVVARTYGDLDFLGSSILAAAGGGSTDPTPP